MKANNLVSLKSIMQYFKRVLVSSSSFLKWESISSNSERYIVQLL